MNWYKVIQNDSVLDNPFVSDTGDLHGYEAFAFRQCQRVDEWSPLAWVKASDPTNDGDPDDWLQNHLGLPIVSPRLREALTAGGVDGIQYLTLGVLLSNLQRIEGFAIANVLNCVEALDIEHSDFDRFGDDYFIPARRGKIRALRSTTLRGEALGEHDVIRLSDFRVAVYVSERFRDIFTKGRFTGISFQEVNLS